MQTLLPLPGCCLPLQQQQQQQQTPLLNVSGVFSIAANWGYTQKEIINVKINKYILKSFRSSARAKCFT